MRRMRRSVRPQAHLLGDERGHVAGSIPDHRHRLLGEGRQDELALGALGQHFARVRVDDLRVEVVLEDVQAALLDALDADAGADDLGQAVDVVGADAALVLDPLAHRVAPGLRPEDADPQLGEVHLVSLADSIRMQEVARRAADRRHAEVLHDHELALGVAAADRNDRRARAPRRRSERPDRR
jgi:hypothetical protein